MMKQRGELDEGDEGSDDEEQGEGASSPIQRPISTFEDEADMVHEAKKGALNAGIAKKGSFPVAKRGDGDGATFESEAPA